MRKDKTTATSAASGGSRVDSRRSLTPRGFTQSGGSRRSLNPWDFIYRVGAWEDFSYLECSFVTACSILGLGLSAEDRT